MSLTLVLGSMFSGKTEALMRRVRRYKAIGWGVLVVNSHLDTRVEKVQQVRSHDGRGHAAVMAESLSNLDVSEYPVVAIDEAQFFSDLVTAVHSWLAQGKHVILSGLNGDFQRRPIGHMLELIPEADEVVWKRALCAVCRDGTLASFSKRLTRDKAVVVAGGSEAYMAVCRKHV